MKRNLKLQIKYEDRKEKEVTLSLMYYGDTVVLTAETDGRRLSIMDLTPTGEILLYDNASLQVSGFKKIRFSSGHPGRVLENIPNWYKNMVG